MKEELFSLSIISKSASEILKNPANKNVSSR
jgi:hypothetical protein